MNALLLESSRPVRDLVKVALLQFDGMTVDCAEDSWALEMVKEKPYELLVVSDCLEAPGDGLLILKQIREMGSQAPAVVLSHDQGAAASRERAALIIMDIVSVPPDTVALFKAIVTAKQKAESGARSAAAAAPPAA